ncbi:MAG TPA: hypothetical protein DDX75_00780 [Phycisphaerales bacterium]|nr:hypothetical protein [Phycisphaerales bacterium]
MSTRIVRSHCIKLRSVTNDCSGANGKNIKCHNCVITNQRGGMATVLKTVFHIINEKYDNRKPACFQILSDEALQSYFLQNSNDSKGKLEKDIAAFEKAIKEYDLFVDERNIFAAELKIFEQRYGNDAYNEAMALSNNLCSIVIGSVAHNLANICFPLIKNTKMILKQYLSENNTNEILSIEQNMQLLKNTIQDLNDYTSQIPERRTVESVHEIVSTANELARDNLELLNINISEIKVKLQQDNGSKLKINRESFLMALVNIIKNAYESFTYASQNVVPEININFNIDGKSVVIEISDNGIGISPKDIQLISTFMPGRSNASKKQSRGFGLPIARRTINAHGGQIFITSKVNIGTTIRIVLPTIIDES